MDMRAGISLAGRWRRGIGKPARVGPGRERGLLPGCNNHAVSRASNARSLLASGRYGTLRLSECADLRLAHDGWRGDVEQV